MENLWITGQAFQDALTRAGSSVTAEQIERWRREGLLPRPNQIGLGRAHGSYVEVPQISIKQALEIERLYAVRRKRDWVGWQLWLRGFDVSECYWSKPLEVARTAILEVQGFAKRAENSQIENEIPSDDPYHMVLSAIRRTPLNVAIEQIGLEYAETLIGFLLEIMQGHFNGFSPDSESRPNEEERDTVLKAMGTKSKFAQVLADFRELIEEELRQLSDAFRSATTRNSILEPTVEARRELLAGIDIALFLHRHSKALIGGSPLRTFNRIAGNQRIALQATMLLIWAEYREISKTILPFSKIFEMQCQALQLTEKYQN